MPEHLAAAQRTRRWVTVKCPVWRKMRRIGIGLKVRKAVSFTGIIPCSERSHSPIAFYT